MRASEGNRKDELMRARRTKEIARKRRGPIVVKERKKERKVERERGGKKGKRKSERNERACAPPVYKPFFVLLCLRH